MSLAIPPAERQPALAFQKRTHYCGLITETEVGQPVTINGWVQINRDLGGIVFVEVRDRSGLIQLVADPAKNPEAHRILSTLKCEDVISATGVVSFRPEETVNPRLATGRVEFYPELVQVISRSKPLPFTPENASDVDESVRMKFRYLDLRSERMQRNLMLRHQVCAVTREFLNQCGFLEVETPILIKTTPEGARDYLVPSRVHAGKFFALPQSPQIFKQLLMVSGFDRYYQIARCFRDEDLRADRQPEFTQIDIEMSFVDQDDVIHHLEQLLTRIFQVAGVTVQTPFPRMTFEEAMNRFGSDKPDTRFGLELVDFTDIMATSGFNAFKSVAQSPNGVVKGLCVSNTESYSRKDYDDIKAMVESWGAKGLAYIVVTEEGLKSPITKFFSEDEIARILERAGAKPGDTLFFVADKHLKAEPLLGRLRLYFGKQHHLIDESLKHLLWVVDFPMFAQEDDGSYSPYHHPFTAPNYEDWAKYRQEPHLARAQAYDIVFNGEEIGGGSVRIHSRELQNEIFETLRLTPDEIQEKFGFLLDAFDYGVPPHGGIALGLDRLIALLCGEHSIRNVIAFPKNNQAICVMTDAPGTASELQMKELHLKPSLPAKR